MKLIKKHIKLLTLMLVVLIIGATSQCNNVSKPKTINEEAVYLNWSDTVDYVGIETCKKCHYDKWETFIHTGMGQSFGHADTSKSIASVDRDSYLYDSLLELSYHPYWSHNQLFLSEFRLTKRDTTHVKNQLVDYVIGSGQHTNSHIFNINGYLHQLPFTWYAQEGKLDLPPGYENGGNERFLRKIGLECMSCHNAMPTGFVLGSQNKFEEVPQGIDCERCHGPGGIHVSRMLKGDYVDTAIATDYSIVNPKKLTTQLQFELCQRCHLQGNTVLAEGKSFFDFKPGMVLSKLMDVYLPRYEGGEDQFIMASHVDRFKQSKCFIQNSSSFNCTSCHNPHVSVKETNIQKFNSTCQGCHKETKTNNCTEEIGLLEKAKFNCVECHMPSSGSIDIPHVTVHDHYIRRPRSKEVDTTEKGRFMGLVAVNNLSPTYRSKAMAYMQQYERFEGQPYYLDSAAQYLSKMGNAYDNIKLWVQYYYLKEDFKSIVDLVHQKNVDEVLAELNTQDYSNSDAWTLYRIGQAFNSFNQKEISLRFMEKAVELAPYQLDFQNKLGTAYNSLVETNKAKSTFEFILNEYPNHKEALNNLGFIALRTGEQEKAEELIKRALVEDPDYELAWLNLANLYFLQQNQQEVKKALEQVLRINPENTQARSVIKQLNF